MTALHSGITRAFAPVLNAPVHRDFVAELERLAGQVRRESNGELFIRAGSMKLALTSAYVMPGSTDVMRLNKPGAYSVGDMLDFLMRKVSNLPNRPSQLLTKLVTRNFPTEAEANEQAEAAEAKKAKLRIAQEKVEQKIEADRKARHQARLDKLASPTYGAIKAAPKKAEGGKKGKK